MIADRHTDTLIAILCQPYQAWSNKQFLRLTQRFKRVNSEMTGFGRQ